MCCDNCSYRGDPEVTIGRRWVAVQWHEYGPVHVLHDDATVTERLTVPGEVAQLPLPVAASADGGAR